MNPLSNLTYDENIKHDTDRLGGSYLHESGVYTATVKHAFLKQSEKGAYALDTHFDLGEGKQHKETFWITNQAGSNTYTNQNGEKNYLPGFITADSLALLTAGQPLSNLNSEDKIVKLYDNSVQQEVPTKVPMFMDIVGKQVKLGLLKQTVFKTAKNDATGKWENTSETREENVVDKFFRASDSKTTSEIRAKADQASFINDWESQWSGKVRDKTKGKATNQTKPVSNGTPKPTTSMFA